MGIAALILGLVSFLYCIICWFPCLGWTSWFMWLLPLVSLILSIVAVAIARKGSGATGMSIAGIVLSALALIVVLVRALVSIFTAGI
jgi:hypothetical protein